MNTASPAISKAIEAARQPFYEVRRSDDGTFRVLRDGVPLTAKDGTIRYYKSKGGARKCITREKRRAK